MRNVNKQHFIREKFQRKNDDAGKKISFQPMPRRCAHCHGITPQTHVGFCPHCHIKFGSSVLRRSRPRSSSASYSTCTYKRICAEYLSSLKWEETYFNRSHNHCYCSECYSSSRRDTLQTGGHLYVIPRGWCRFGLHVDQVRAHVDQIWDTWVITYHGTSAIAAQSIVTHRQFLVPGDRCIDGSMIAIRPGHIKDKNQIYTSPTIAYSSHSCYCPTQRFHSRITNKTYNAKIVLQCRQEPGAFTVQGETIGAGARSLCRFIPNDEIEFYTTIRAAIVAYGLLIELTEIA